MSIFPSYLKKSIYSGLTFFLTVLILSIWYGALNGGFTSSDRVVAWSGLTANSWNKIIDGIVDLDTRTAPISSSAGNVGIGVINPGEKLEVAGNVKISGQIINDAWISISAFSNGWSLASPIVGGSTPSYRKDKFGQVSLRGCLTPGTWSMAAFTLPVGYRPSVKMTALLTAYAAGVWTTVSSYVWIFPDGTVNPWLGNSATWVCMDGIRFSTD